jgi:hypothetical protein
MKLTKKKAIKLFREHWRWLAETGSTIKSNWPGHDFLKDEIASMCFLCEYMDQVDGENGGCDGCLIDWPGENCADKHSIGDDKGLFAKWWKAKTEKTRQKYAKIISELPEK